jgi:UDP-N-acetylglucosamine 2-epimerase
MESGSFALPVVDVGLRQRGRERGPNVLHAEADSNSIGAALAVAGGEAFHCQLNGMTNPYGDGCAAERIASVLANLPSRERLLFKNPAEFRP